MKFLHDNVKTFIFQSFRCEMLINCFYREVIHVSRFRIKNKKTCTEKADKLLMFMIFSSHCACSFDPTGKFKLPGVNFLNRLEYFISLFPIFSSQSRRLRPGESVKEFSLQVSIQSQTFYRLDYSENFSVNSLVLSCFSRVIASLSSGKLKSSEEIKFIG